MGDGAAVVALLLYASGSSAPASAVTGLLVAQSLPRFFSPLAGSIADRVDRRRLMILTDVGQLAIFGLIAAATPPLAATLVLIALASALSTIFSAAGRTVIPALVEERELMTANAWVGTAFNLQAAVGPILGGVLTAAVGLRGALGLNALSFACSAVLLLRLPGLQPPGATPAAGMRGFWTTVSDGFRYARGHRVARALAVTLFAGVLFGSLDNVALVFLARRELGAGAIGFGILSAAFGVAMIAASLWLVRVAERRRPLGVYLAGWSLLGLGLLTTGWAPIVAIAVVTQAVAGAGNALTNVAEDTMIQSTVAPEFLGRVHGLLSACAFFGSTVAYVIGGALVASVSPRLVFLIAGIGVLVSAFSTAPQLRRADTARSADTAQSGVEGDASAAPVQSGAGGGTD